MEDIINQIDGKIQIIFEKTSDTFGTYRDALWFTQEEYDILTPEQISTMQQQRFDNWLVIINPPSTETTSTE
jgi:hypothetical protein